MKFKILEIEEKDGQLRIKIKSKFGEEIVGCKNDMKSLHVESGKPQWMHVVKEKLDKKYNLIIKKAFVSDEFKEFVEKEFDTTKIEDYSRKTLSKLAMKEKKLTAEQLKLRKINEGLESIREEIHAVEQETFRITKAKERTAQKLSKTLKNNGKKLQPKVQL